LLKVKTYCFESLSSVQSQCEPRQVLKIEGPYCTMYILRLRGCVGNIGRLCCLQAEKLEKTGNGGREVSQPRGVRGFRRRCCLLAEALVDIRAKRTQILTIWI
jgi:hypothetical protein